MSYQVLARKWRPRTFRELVGQEHVVRALTHALDQKRLHHAFLFTGTRGVGKTTIARIFAKSLNCEIGVSSTPCGQCVTCREIDDGRFIDLIEVDAASRTKVDETRELLENVRYTPTRGRYKVYLIDEVHMFSNHSFNALLKTLEEPPPHVKFLLATTDPQKLPVTVLSRCLQFSLKRLPTDKIARHLQNILEQEHILGETAALYLIAEAGEGSMRDALSLLDQAIAFGGGQVTAAAVRTMLGNIDRRRGIGLLEALAACDAPLLLQRVAELDEHAPDYAAVLAELLSLLQRVALIQVVPNAFDGDEEVDSAELRRFASMIPPEDVQLFYQIALLGRRDLPLAPDPRGGFEMILLRMLCFRPITAEVVGGTTVIPQNVRTPAGGNSKGEDQGCRGSSAKKEQGKPCSLTEEDWEERSTPVEQDEGTDFVPEEEEGRGKSVSIGGQEKEEAHSASEQWGALIHKLDLNAKDKNLVARCEWVDQGNHRFQLRLEPSLEPMWNAATKARLKAALEKYFGRPTELEFQVDATVSVTPQIQQQRQQAARRQAAAEYARHDPYVREVQERFNATIAAVHPLDDTAN